MFSMFIWGVIFVMWLFGGFYFLVGFNWLVLFLVSFFGVRCVIGFVFHRLNVCVGGAGAGFFILGVSGGGSRFEGCLRFLFSLKIY